MIRLLHILIDRAIFLVVDVGLLIRYPGGVLRLWKYNFDWLATRASVAAPSTSNSKYLWRKLLDHDPRFVVLSDKLANKAYIPMLGVPVAAPETLWVGTPDTLPDRFLGADVLIKANHGWNTNIMPARHGLSPEDVRRRAHVAYKQNHGHSDQQWAYTRIPRKLFVETRLAEIDTLLDLYVYTHGNVVTRVVLSRTEPSGKRHASVWFADGRGSFVLGERASSVNPAKIDDRPLPETTAEAVRLALKVGRYFDHMRVDFMTDGTELFLGECTVYNRGGRETGGEEVTVNSNVFWDLRRSWFLNARQKGWRAIYQTALRRFCDREEARKPPMYRFDPLAREDFERSLAIASSLQGEEPCENA